MIEEVISKEEYKNDINLLSNLAYIYIDLKDYNSALTYLQRLKELGRNDEWLNKNLEFVHSKIKTNYCLTTYSIRVIINLRWSNELKRPYEITQKRWLVS